MLDIDNIEIKSPMMNIFIPFDLRSNFMQLDFHDYSRYCNGNSGFVSDKFNKIMVENYAELCEHWGIAVWHDTYTMLMFLISEPRTVNRIRIIKSGGSSLNYHVQKRVKSSLLPKLALAGFKRIMYNNFYVDEVFDTEDNNFHKLPMNCRTVAEFYK
jgi:hypothetical protein